MNKLLFGLMFNDNHAVARTISEENKSIPHHRVALDSEQPREAIVGSAQQGLPEPQPVSFTWLRSSAGQWQRQVFIQAGSRLHSLVTCARVC